MYYLIILLILFLLLGNVLLTLKKLVLWVIKICFISGIGFVVFFYFTVVFLLLILSYKPDVIKDIKLFEKHKHDPVFSTVLPKP